MFFHFEACSQPIPGKYLAQVRGRFRISAALFCILACSSNPSAPTTRDEVISTEKRDYAAELNFASAPLIEYTLSVEASFQNDHAHAVRIAACFGESGPMYGVESIETDMASAYDPQWSCGASEQGIVVESGQVRTDTLRLRGPWVRSGEAGEPVGLLDGTFQLVYTITCTSCDNPQPKRVNSNSFIIRLPE
jgi:hypothetical protein